jgi:hypothetical protein
MKSIHIGVLCFGLGTLFGNVLSAAGTTENEPLNTGTVAEEGAGSSLLMDIENALQEDRSAPRKSQTGDEYALPVSPSRNAPVNGNEANPSISVILDVAGAWFQHDEHYRQGGHAPSQTGPAIQGAELAFSTSIDPYFALDVAFGMFHLHLEEAYMTTTALPLNLQLRAGKYKSAIGRHNRVHLHSWNFVNQPLANEWLFGAEGMSLPGMELSWLIPIPWYALLIGSIQMGSAGAFKSPTIENGEPGLSDFIYPIRLVQYFDVTPDILFQFGLNVVLGKSAVGPESGNRTYAYGADFVLKWRPTGEGHSGNASILWETETWFRQMEAPGTVWNDAGGYSALVAGLSKRLEASIRAELWRQLSGNHAASRQRYGVDAFQFSAAISYLPSHFSRIRLQHTVSGIDEFVNSHAVFLQMEVSGGAHRAHQF